LANLVADRGHPISTEGESNVQDIDRIAEANAAIDRRARQRVAAAAAQAESNTPEAIAAELERQRVHAALEQGVIRNPPEEKYGQDAELLSQDEANVAFEDPSLDQKLASALQPIVDTVHEVEPKIIGIGRSVFQWVLVPSEDPENLDGYQLAFQLQVDEQQPGGFIAEITREDLARWARGKGLQGNHIEHKQFVSALFERALAIGMNETGNQLVYILEHLMLGGAPDYSVFPAGSFQDEPTRTSVGEDDVSFGEESNAAAYDPGDPFEDDGPFADAPENADEVPE
jgi:hypothetical protein